MLMYNDRMCLSVIVMSDFTLFITMGSTLFSVKSSNLISYCHLGVAYNEVHCLAEEEKKMEMTKRKDRQVKSIPSAS